MSDWCLYVYAYSSHSMPTRYTVVCDDDLTREVKHLARQYNISEEEVLRQLIDLGFEQLEKEAVA